MNGDTHVDELDDEDPAPESPELADLIAETTNLLSQLEGELLDVVSRSGASERRLSYLSAIVGRMARLRFELMILSLEEPADQP